MNCQKAKDLITIGIFGKLTPEQRRELDDHIKDCPECARLAEKSAPLLDRRREKEAPPPDLDKSWRAISAETLERRRPRVVKPVRKWALAAASLLVVFILGYFAGKMVLSDGKEIPSGSAAIPSLTAYADNLRPVLINFLNSREEAPPEIRKLESRIIGDMLQQTRMLKDLAARAGDRGKLELLQDLEFILISMNNLQPDDRESARHLARMIRDKDISLKLRELITYQSAI
jgi:hypothetical protein